MGHTLLCMLGLFSLNILLHCGHAQDAVLTIEPNWSTFFTRESVTFICDTEGKNADWYHSIRRNGFQFVPYNTKENHTLQHLDTSYSGEYQCLSHIKGSTKESNKVSLTVSDKDVILETPASTLFEGESVTLRCRHRYQTKKKNAAFYKDGSPIEIDTNHQSPMISKNTVQIMSDGSSYTCKFDEEEESDPIKLRMEPQPKAQLSADWRDILAGGSVILTCSVRPSSSSGWKYFWYRGNKISEPLTTQDDDLLSNGQIRVPQGGLYWCRGGRGDPVYYTEYSDPVVTNRAVVTPRPNWPEIYSGETITLTCEVEDGGDAEWEYEWTTPISYRPQNPSEHMIRPSHSGDYWCKGTKKSEKSSTEWSNPLRVSFNKPQPVLTVSPLWLSPGDSVTLNCNVTDPSAGWRFYWYKAVHKPEHYFYSYELLPGSTNGTEQDSYIVHGQTHTAGYYCRAGRGDPVFHSDYSKPKFVWSGDFHSAASLTVSPDRAQHFKNESVSLSCEGNSTKWRVMWFSEYGSLIPCTILGTMTGSTCTIDRYWLSGVHWCESETGQFSNAVNITMQYNDIILVSPVHPVAEGHPVTLGCKFRTEKVLHDVDFYKNDKLIKNHTNGELIISAVSKSDEGFYRCEGKESPEGWRGLSEESWMSVKHAVLTIEPNWPTFFTRESVTFICDMRNRKDTDWSYTFMKDGHEFLRYNLDKRYTLQSVDTRDSGEYQCFGSLKGPTPFRKESTKVSLTVSEKPQPVLTVSPLWLSPGDSVTLKCNVTDPSAGWRFYWYKAVPKPAGYSYSYELLPGSTNGTEQDSYIVHGQTHTAGYYCRAGRGDPVFHSDYSKPTFVWSGDFHSAASLTVSPDRAQHFKNESVSLSCEGNSTKWRVSGFSESGSLLDCTIWGTMTGSTCTINRSWNSGVYWCESETGQFSNAVNITMQDDGIILVSPVHPVAEGHPVTLGCKLKTEKVLHDVDFYKNDKLIKNHTNGELIISAVSTSDEGFYRCEGKESPPGWQSWTSKESWISVKHVPASGPEKSSPFPVLVIVGLVCGVLLIILLLLFLYRYRKSKDSCFKRSQSTNQGPATDHMINQDETQSRVYASLLHGDLCLYETIQGAGQPENGENNEPEERVYSNVTTRSAADQ